jgi:hypothetical protein
MVEAVVKIIDMKNILILIIGAITSCGALQL